MYLLFDIGGTNTRIAFAKTNDSFGDLEIIPTEPDFEDAFVSMENVAKKLVGNDAIDKVIVGITGRLDKDRSYIFKSSSLPGWVNKPLLEKFETVFAASVVIGNDADIVGLGEVHYGAGVGTHSMMYITISTGVGGGMIHNGRIVESQYSPEVGYQNIFGFGATSSNGREYDALQDFVSGKAIQKRYGQDPKEITDKKIWDEVARLIAYGIHNSIVHWTPDVVVMGGSVMKSVACEQVHKHLSDISQIYPELPELKLATLDDIGGLYGALAYAQKTN